MKKSIIILFLGLSLTSCSSDDFETIEKEGKEAIHKWINKQLEGTSVTVVLIGTDTSNRPYVKYELKEVMQKEMGC